jgi:hypothetical protein
MTDGDFGGGDDGGSDGGPFDLNDNGTTLMSSFSSPQSRTGVERRLGVRILKRMARAVVVRFQ